jgi:predicted RNA-binding protein with RPS1 domain
VIQHYRKGDMVKAVVTEVDTEKERISLSIKAVDGDPFADAIDGVKRGSVITVEVTAIEDGGIEVDYNGMKSFIRRSDLSRDRAEQRPERFQVGDKVDVRVTNVDSRSRRLGLSIKAREIAEEKEAVEQYGSSDSGRIAGRYSRRRAQQGRLSEIGPEGPQPSDGYSRAPLRAGPFSFAADGDAKNCGYLRQVAERIAQALHRRTMVRA